MSDFSEKVFADKNASDIVPKVALVPVDGKSPASAFIEVTLSEGETLHAETLIIPGHPENPVSGKGLTEKFNSFVEPVLGANKAPAILDLASQVR